MACRLQQLQIRVKKTKLTSLQNDKTAQQEIKLNELMQQGAYDLEDLVKIQQFQNQNKEIDIQELLEKVDHDLDADLLREQIRQQQSGRVIDEGFDKNDPSKIDAGLSNMTSIQSEEMMNNCQENFYTQKEQVQSYSSSKRKKKLNESDTPIQLRFYNTEDEDATHEGKAKQDKEIHVSTILHDQEENIHQDNSSPSPHEDRKITKEAETEQYYYDNQADEIEQLEGISIQNSKTNSKSVISVENFGQEEEKEQVEKVDLDNIYHQDGHFQNQSKALQLPYGVLQDTIQGIIKQDPDKILSNKKSEPQTDEKEELNQKLHNLQEQEIQKWDQIIKDVNELKLEQLGEGQIQQKIQNFLEILKEQSDLNKRLLQENLSTSQMLAQKEQLVRQKFVIKQKEEEKKEVLQELVFKSKVRKVGKAKSQSRKAFEAVTSQSMDLQSLQYSQSNQDQQYLQPMSIDLQTGRKSFGSEKLFQDTARAFVTQSQTPPVNESEVHNRSAEANEVSIIKKESLFTRQPFKQFTQQQFKQMLKKDDMDNLINMREEALDYRHIAEKEVLETMLTQKKLSQLNYNMKRQRLDKWIQKEKIKITMLKKDILKGFCSTAETIKRTQRDINYMRKMFSKYGILDSKTITSAQFKYFNLWERKNTSKENSLNRDPYSENQDDSIKLSDSGNLNLQLQDIPTSEHSSQKLFSRMQQNGSDLTSSLRKSKSMQESDEFGLSEKKDLPTVDDQQQTDKEQRSQIKSSGQGQDKELQQQQLIDEVEVFGNRKEMDQIIEDCSSDMNSQEDIEKLQLLTSKTGSQATDEVNEDQTSEDEFVLTKDKKVDIITNQIMEMLLLDMDNEIDDSGSVNPYISHQIDIFGIYPERANMKDLAMMRDDMRLGYGPFGQNAGQIFTEDSIVILLPFDLPPGINTSLMQTQKYLNILVETIIQKYQNQFIERINLPLGFTPTERLNHLHIFDTSQTDSISVEISHQQPVIEPEFYVQVAEQIVVREFVNDYPQDEFALEAEHIHNKLLFDGLNDALDFYRPYGLNGQTYPWKRYLQHQQIKQLQKENFKEVLQEAKEKVFEWATYQCGLLIEKNCAIFAHFLSRGLQLDEAYLQQIREEKLHNMLAIEVYENEDKWINYDEEETEVGVELTDMAFEDIINSFTNELIGLRKRRNDPGYFDQEEIENQEF